MAEKTKIILTQEDRDILEKEYRHLIDVERPDVIEKLQLARSQGDLSENADYDAARDRQAQVERRISEIEAIFASATMASETSHSAASKVSISDVVEYEKEDGTVLSVKIRGNVGADPTALPPSVSNESPIGKALLGQKVGATVRVECDEPYNITIRKISR